MRKNNYDKFAAARQKELITGQKKPHRFVEKPMMRKMLPNLKNKAILLIGCGTGEESKLLEEFGAKEIIGIDTSKASIDLANKTYPKHRFIVGDMHKLKFKNNSFDFVYSSLAIHYSKNPKIIYKEIGRVLKPKGQLLFSVGHPIRWASEEVIIGDTPFRITGFSEESRDSRLFGNYLTFKKHKHTFKDNEVLEFWVGPPSLHFKLLKESGFNIENFMESRAIPEARKVDSWYHKRYTEFPQFMAFLAKAP